MVEPSVPQSVVPYENELIFNESLFNYTPAALPSNNPLNFIGGLVVIPQSYTPLEQARRVYHEQLYSYYNTALAPYNYIAVLKSGYGPGTSTFGSIFPVQSYAFDFLPRSRTPLGTPEPNVYRIITPYSEYMAQQGIAGRFANIFTGAVLGGGVLSGYEALTAPTTPSGVFGPSLPSGQYYVAQENVVTGFSGGDIGVSSSVAIPKFLGGDGPNPGLDLTTATQTYGVYSFVSSIFGSNPVTQWIDNTIGNILRVFNGQPIVINTPVSRPPGFINPNIVGGSAYSSGGGSGFVPQTNITNSSPFPVLLFVIGGIVLLWLMLRKRG